MLGLALNERKNQLEINKRMERKNGRYIKKMQEYKFNGRKSE
jgi:hypothetical protein